MLLRTQAAPYRRRGVVLLAVLLIVVVLALAAYQYGEWMTSEFQAANAYTRTAQAHALAESGVHYVAAMIAASYAANAANSNTTTSGGAGASASSTSSSDPLDGNPFDNAQMFQNVVVSSDDSGGPTGAFSIVGLLPDDDPDQASTPYRFGLVDEAGKININAIIQLDNGQGDIAYQLLMGLPNMTDDVANSILDWLDADDTPRTDGAEDDYYSSLPNPYHCKNGPLDSLEELLLVKGVTPQLLYGNDRNRNGVLDAGEDDGSGGVDLGWAQYLTVYSHEPNTDYYGNPRIYINDPDIDTMGNNLSPVLGDDMTNFIIAYRLYGAASSSTTATLFIATGGGGVQTATATITTPSSGAASTYAPLSGGDADAVSSALQTARTASSQSSGSGGQTQQLKQISSVFDLVNASVSVPTGSGNT
ncbi:MAG TPA: hypothetical protein VMS17_10505, partial [Gemmataceae bacterium]|nr:hypothetical protein [Gemmataceae bacterium]